MNVWQQAQHSKSHCDSVMDTNLDAQNESSQSTIHIRQMKACSRFTEYKFCYTKSATCIMIPVLTCKVSTDFINDSFSLVFSRNSSSSSIIDKV